MAKTMVFVISEEAEGLDSVKTFCSAKGINCFAYSPGQWREGMDNPVFRNQLLTGVPQIISANLRNNVLPFPGVASNSSGGLELRPAGAPNSTMEEMESRAIEAAIVQYRGNLTEAAKALGIGRATLYRKVKAYQIDPANARKKRAA